MASYAALRSGAGVVFWAIPKSLNPIAEALCVEVITLPIPETSGGSPGVDAREHLVEAAREADVVIMGPGLPVAGETGELMRLLVPEIYSPLVLDAGALTAIGNDYGIFNKRKGATIITPHPGEMSSLANLTTEKIMAKRMDIAKQYAKITGTIVLLKGKDTVVTNGVEVHLNKTGNPGMATAGSGDVLSGIIAALVAQNMSPFDAARLGAHLHGLAGDLAAVDKGMHGLTATDIIDYLPAAFRRYANGS